MADNKIAEYNTHDKEVAWDRLRRILKNQDIDTYVNELNVYNPDGYTPLHQVNKSNVAI